VWGEDVSNVDSIPDHHRHTRSSSCGNTLKISSRPLLGYPQTCTYFFGTNQWVGWDKSDLITEMRPGLIVSDRLSWPLVSVLIYRPWWSYLTRPEVAGSFRLTPCGTTSALVPSTRMSRRRTNELLISLLTSFAQNTKVKTQQVVRNRGQRCGDSGHRVGRLPRECDVSDAFGAWPPYHLSERFGSSSDPSLNGHLDYPNDIDRSLKETATDKIIILQTHRETHRFFAALGVHLAQSNSGHVHYHRVAFSSQLKSKCGNILAKAATLRIFFWISTERLWRQDYTLTHRTRKPLVY
jgi:hypothetical protein